MSDSNLHPVMQAALAPHMPRALTVLAAAKAHLAARDALESANVNNLHVDDPRFAAVAETAAQLRAAITHAEAE